MFSNSSRWLVAFALAVPVFAQAPVPAAAPTASSATALAQARDIVVRVMPPGAMQKMISGMGDQFMGRMVDGMLDQNLAQLSALAGVDAKTLKATTSQGTLREIIAITDPAFSERMARTSKIMFDEMAKVMGTLEPEMREAMAAAYARSATPAELSAAHAFYLTPEGASFAAKQLQVASDPSYLALAQSMSSKIIAAMPAIMQRTKQATADLPQPRRPDQLTQAERAKLKQLLGVAAPATRK